MDTDWLWQGIAANLISDALALAIYSAWKRREKILESLSRTPKPIVVPLKPLNISSKLGKAAITAGSEVKAAANVYSTVTKDLTLLWNTEEPTPPRIWRLLDEGLEVLSYIPFTYKSK